MVDNNFSISKFLDNKGYKYNSDYIYLTSYQNNRVYILLVDDSIYTIMVMDGYRYVFEMAKGSKDVVSEFEREIKQTVSPTDDEVELD